MKQNQTSIQYTQGFCGYSIAWSYMCRSFWWLCRYFCVTDIAESVHWFYYSSLLKLLLHCIFCHTNLLWWKSIIGLYFPIIFFGCDMKTNKNGQKGTFYSCGPIVYCILIVYCMFYTDWVYSIQFNFIYIVPNHHKSHLMTLYLQSRSRPYSF